MTGRGTGGAEDDQSEEEQHNFIRWETWYVRFLHLIVKTISKTKIPSRNPFAVGSENSPTL